MDDHSSSTSKLSNLTKQITPAEMAPDRRDPRTPSQQSVPAAESTNSHPDTAPVQKVIGTFELCEQILADLTCIELGRARRVCRQFCAVIDKSPTLRKELYLDARVDNSIAACHEFMLARGSKARLLISKTASSDMPAKEITLYELHPVLKHHDHQTFLELGFRAREENSYLVFIKSFTRTCITQIPRDSALNDMYICQPPIQDVVVSIKGDPGVGGIAGVNRFTGIHSDDGVTFGLLIDFVRKVIDDNKDAHPHVDYLHLGLGVALTAAEMRTLEVTGTVNSQNDPHIGAERRKQIEDRCEAWFGKRVFELE